MNILNFITLLFLILINLILYKSKINRNYIYFITIISITIFYILINNKSLKKKSVSKNKLIDFSKNKEDLNKKKNNFLLLPENIKKEKEKEENKKKENKNLIRERIEKYPLCKFNGKNCFNNNNNNFFGNVTPNIPDGILMNGTQPICKIPDNIQIKLFSKKNKNINYSKGCCPLGFKKKKNGVCQENISEVCLQGQCIDNLF